MKVAVLITGITLMVSLASSDVTWPSVIDEMEDIMFLTTGYRSRGFADAVVPCSKPPAGATGRKASAEWIRTAFHDAASGTVATGVGGADGSIMFEISRSENVGAAFNTTLNFMASFYNRKASAADLIALGLYTATRSCGGPNVPIRVGRIDATKAGPNGFIPVPESAAGTFQNQFTRLGFTVPGMIALTACGHTVGGVHSVNFPRIVLPAADGSDVYALDDTTPDYFDNRIVTEWINGNTTNPMAVGISVANSRNSDAKVYNRDNNATMNTLLDPAVFASQCASTFQQMIEIVPSGVTLTSDPMVPYEVKPSFLQLTLLGSGARLRFSGEVRVRTTVRSQSQIASVQLNYLNRNGVAGGMIMSSPVGTGGGFDDSFAFYSFSAEIDAIESISAFTVQINLVGGSSETHDNHGTNYPMSDHIMLQIPQSCIALTPDVNGNKALTVVAAVRNTLSTANLVMSLATPRSAIAIPLLTSTTQSMTSESSVGPYDIYSTTYNVSVFQAATMTFDVVTGSFSDSFKSTGSLGNTCEDLVGSSSSTATTTSSSLSTFTSISSSLASTFSTSTSSTTSSSLLSTSTITTAPISSPTMLSCPQSNAIIYTAPSGQTFEVECYNDHAAGDLSMSYVSTLISCIDLCDSTASCAAYSWESTQNGISNPCYLKSNIGADQENNGVWGGKLIS